MNHTAETTNKPSSTGSDASSDVLFTTKAADLADALHRAALSDSARLLKALDSHVDPFEILETTTAITDEPADGDGGNFVRLDRIVEDTAPLDLIYPRPVRSTEDLPRLSATTACVTDVFDITTKPEAPPPSPQQPPNSRQLLVGRSFRDNAGKRLQHCIDPGCIRVYDPNMGQAVRITHRYRQSGIEIFFARPSPHTR